MSVHGSYDPLRYSDNHVILCYYLVFAPLKACDQGYLVYVEN